jgi:nicotinate-nucleotide adenylyltransferase
LRLAVYGGTFDPIHMAHLIIAEFARENFDIDKILFTPSYIPPHKIDVQISAADHRLEMIRLAVDGHANFEICDYEIEKKGTSYTVNTLQYLHEKYNLSRDDFYFILGADNMKDFHHWKQPEKIDELVQIVVAGRKDFENNNSQYSAASFEFPLLDISSSLVRQRRKDDKSIKYLVPAPVESYIYEHELYH